MIDRIFQVSLRAAALLVAGAGLSTDLRATTWYVDDDFTSGVPHDGLSWNGAFLSLQTAIAVSQAGDEIWVASGSYRPAGGAAREATFPLKDGVGIYGGFSGTETLRSERDPDPATNGTVLSGDLLYNDGPDGANMADNTYHVVTCSGVDGTAVLDGFTITAGNADGADIEDNPHKGGGGLYADNATPTLSNCAFIGNRALYGGAVCSVNGSQPRLEGGSLTGNHATIHGGAVFTEVSSRISILRCVLSGNTSDGSGGAIYNRVGTSYLTNCVLSGNFANSSGAAIFNYQGHSHCMNCTITGNNWGDFGSSVLNDYYSSSSFTNSIVWGDNGGNHTSLKNYGEITFKNTLVEHRSASNLDDSTAASSDNLDGTDPDNDPLFLIPLNGAAAPTHSGRFSLSPGSPVAERGRSGTASGDFDLAGHARRVGPIDLGAYERQAVLHVDAAATAGAGDGSSWADAFTGLQQALAAAVDGNEIWVAAGTYAPTELTNPADDRSATFALRNGVALFGGFPTGGGGPSFTARDRGATVLSGDLLGNDGPGFANTPDNAYHVVTGSGADCSAVLNGFSITAGNAAVSGLSVNGEGGGLYNDHGSPTLVDCEISGNQALYQGGGMSNRNSSPGLVNCVVSGNKAEKGGGIFNEHSDSVFTNCALTGNLAGSIGGAVSNRFSPVRLINCTISGNSSGSDGGGISNEFSDAALTNCVIWNNQSSGSTTSSYSSISNNTSSYPTYVHCLVQGYDPAVLNSSGFGNLQGLGLSNDPLFFGPIDPTTAPTTAGNPHFLFESPLIDAGEPGPSSIANPTGKDLDGNSRSLGDSTDLGCFEGNVGSTFAVLFPDLDPATDANGNGNSNYMDYALGADPRAEDDRSLLPRIYGNFHPSADSALLTVTFHFRAQAADVFPIWYQSTDLENWKPMVSGEDYFEESFIYSTGIHGVAALELWADDPTGQLFFRQGFSTEE